jgi:hypothetical protein
VCFIIIALSLLVPVPLVAMGNPDVGLPKVDRLIKERNYNEAIRELAIYMNDNPDDFDGTQERIRKVIAMRQNYNDKALELLLVLAQEPTNDQKKLEMITYMESLEKNPNAATQNFIAETKAAAQFTYYRAKFDEIMTTGNSLIDQGSYVEAAKKFSEGFALYKQEFDAEQKPELVDTVNATLSSIDANIALSGTLQAPLSAAVAAYEAALSADNAPLAETAADTLGKELARFITLRNTVAEKGWYFQDSFERQKASTGVDTENSFLPFAWRFAVGRRTGNRFEGVLGSFDAQIDVLMSRLEKSTEAACRRAWIGGYAALDAAESDTAISLFSSAERFAVAGSRLVKSGSALTNRSDTFGVRNYVAESFRFDGLADLAARAGATGKLFGEYHTYVSAFAGFTEEADSPVSIRKAPSATVKKYTGWTDGLGDYISRINALAAGTGRNSAENDGYAKELSEWNAGFSATATAARLGLFRKNAAFQERSVAVISSSWTTEYKNALALLDGITKEPGGSPLYYPSESISAFTRIRSGLTDDRKAVQQAVSGLEKAPRDVLADKDFATSVDHMRAALPGFDSLFADSAAGITRANSRVLQANLARQESDLRYNQAKSALAKQDFQSARDNLQRSRDKINVSLGLQESVALRTDSDKKLEALGAEITRIENEAVVREVRALISSGKNFYYRGDFDQAEQIFLQAKTRWTATNIEANAEVANWLDIINTALSMKTGRTIPVTAPLYPQMSQILSTANQLYIEGKNLMAKSSRAAALEKLTEARVQLQQLQLVYPLNQDAGQLTLRINQLIDPAAFRDFFGQKVDEIRANYKSTRQTAYSDLLDLYQINSSYPGIKKLLDDVEYYLGVKIPPPDPKDIARSTELTKSAQKIYDANTRSMFQVALDQLDEAIKLNPDNSSAIALKDRVQTASGGQSVAVLSGDDEAIYQRAVKELQSGNKITASALVEQLLQNAKAKNSAKVQDLKKRIDSLL